MAFLVAVAIFSSGDFFNRNGAEGVVVYIGRLTAHFQQFALIFVGKCYATFSVENHCGVCRTLVGNLVASPTFGKAFRTSIIGRSGEHLPVDRYIAAAHVVGLIGIVLPKWGGLQCEVHHIAFSVASRHYEYFAIGGIILCGCSTIDFCR